ncbi:MAG: GerMN domain-containing protein [Candidatus Caldarchaeum sp.]
MPKKFAPRLHNPLRRTQGGTGPSLLWFLAGAALAIFFALFWYVRVGPPNTLQPKSQDSVAKTSTFKHYARVPYLTIEDGEPRWTIREEEISPKADKLQEAINRFLEESAIAPKAELTSVQVRGNQVELYFENLFEKSYGTDNDSLLLEGIFKAIKENSHYGTVVFLENGKPAQTLGNLDVEGPQKVR